MLKASFLSHLFQPREPAGMAELRAENIRLGTQVILLEDILNHRTRVLREPRKDKASVKAAKAATTDALRKATDRARVAE